MYTDNITQGNSGPPRSNGAPIQSSLRYAPNLINYSQFIGYTMGNIPYIQKTGYTAKPIDIKPVKSILISPGPAPLQSSSVFNSFAKAVGNTK